MSSPHESVPGVAQLGENASQKDQVIAVLQDTVERLDRGDLAPADALEDLQAALRQVAAKRNDWSAVLDDRRFGSFMKANLARMIARGQGLEPSIPLPWPSLAQALGGGLWPGAHIVVGNTGSGKTQFGLQIALCAALAEVPTAYIPLELGDLDTTARLVGLHLHRTWSRLFFGVGQSGDPTYGTGPGTEIVEILGARGRELDELANAPFHSFEGPPHGWPYTELEPLAEAMRAKYPLRIGSDGQPIRGSVPMLLVLDFLQLTASPDGQREDLRERIGRAAYAARAIARDLDVAVVLVSSTPRQSYSLLEYRPEKDDGDPPWESSPRNYVGLGKESGDIEFSADSVTVLVREEVPKGVHTPIHAAVAKVRAGEPTWVHLVFDGSRFREPTQFDRDEAEKRQKERQAARGGPDGLLHANVDTIRQRLASGDFDDVLDDIVAAERLAKQRKGVFAAVQERRMTLQKPPVKPGDDGWES